MPVKVDDHQPGKERKKRGEVVPMEMLCKVKLAVHSARLPSLLIIR